MRTPLAKSSQCQSPTKPILMTAPNTGNAPVPTLCFKCLTTVEMAAKHEKGECYNCTEPFSCEHLNVSPMKVIYVLQMDEDSPLEEVEEGNPCISLHAIAGLANSEMMQLVVRVDNTTIKALVDSGSTHSFITARAANLHVSITASQGNESIASSTSSSTPRNSSSTSSSCHSTGGIQYGAWRPVAVHARVDLVGL
jgi:hypothetical protein